LFIEEYKYRVVFTIYEINAGDITKITLQTYYVQCIIRWLESTKQGSDYCRTRVAISKTINLTWKFVQEEVFNDNYTINFEDNVQCIKLCFTCNLGARSLMECCNACPVAQTYLKKLGTD